MTLFTDPPPQLRLVPDVDSVKITLSGVAPSVFQRHPLWVGAVCALVLNVGIFAEHVWSAILLLIVGGVVVNWSSDATAQTVVEITPARVRWNQVDLALDALERVELVHERAGPALQLHHRGDTHLLDAQHEPEHHVRWVARQLERARDRSRQRGTERDIPRSLRALRE